MKQLRLTTTHPMSMFEMMSNISEYAPLIIPTDIGEMVMDKIKGRSAYIHGEAEDLAGFDIPTFIDGNLGQLDLPIEEQDILLSLPSGEYKCKAEFNNKIPEISCYLITLISEPSALSN